MNDQQENTLGNLAGGATQLNTPTSQLQTALNENADQLSKLADLVAQLADRLVPVRNIMPQPENGNAQKDVSASSSVVSQVTYKTDQVKHLQGRITEMLQDLEV